MTGKNVFYAAVGAPVVAARKVADAVAELRSTLNKETETLGKTANKRVAVWADEGEKLVNRITDVKMVDELTSKVDFDQVSNQVGKLREQLEDMLATWRASFRPEKMPTVKVEASLEGVTVETTRPVARTSGTGRATKKAIAVKKAPARPNKAAAKTTAATRATSKAPAATKAPVQKASVKKASVKKVSVKKASVENASVRKAPVRKAPVRKASVGKANATALTSAGIAT